MQAISSLGSLLGGLLILCKKAFVMSIPTVSQGGRVSISLIKNLQSSIHIVSLFKSDSLSP